MKKLIPPIIGLIAILLITQGDSAPLVSFLIAGVVPGTAIILPSWAMIIAYCLIITAIITLYVEGTLVTMRADRATKKRRQQLPRHRFSQI